MQENGLKQDKCMNTLLVGKVAPFFQSKAVKNGEIINNFSLQDFLGEYVVFFFYPLDFTFVCPTELHAFQEKKEEFHKRNAQIVGCSVDSVYTHQAWLRTPRAQGGIQGIEYPIVSDMTKSIAREYGVLHEQEGIAFRGLFLIDQEGIVRHMLVNDLFMGRSVDEVLRTIDALIFFKEHGEVCPANWHVGHEGMKPTNQGVCQYFSAH